VPNELTQVRIGRIGRAHGLAGEVTLERCSLDADELEAVAEFEWRGRNGVVLPLTLTAARPMNRLMLVKFRGYEDRDHAAGLGLGELFADAARLPDPGPGVSYTFQLIGLKVVAEDGRELGVLEDVLSTGAHPVYIVQGERELLVPATPEVVQRVDLEAGTIVVRLPAGLEDL
jgi:16S rRNA processing protein RimM